ncbi:MAG: diguanylate cyclase [Lachnospiraceae bacterium]|nr:diguanylate cyclase [Lachnospiraceae bacterium]
MPYLKQQIRKDIVRVSVVGMVLSLLVTAVVLIALTRINEEQDLEDAISYCCDKLDEYTVMRNNVLVEYQMDMYTKARAVRDYIALDPSVLEDEERFASFCKEQELDQVCITDDKAVVITSYPAVFFGEDLNNYEETKKYVELIENEKLVIVESGRVDRGKNSASRKMEYVGISRKDAPGIIQVSVYSSNAVESRMDVSIKGIAENLTVGRNGGVMITDSGYIVGAKDENYIGGNAESLFDLPDEDHFVTYLFGEKTFVKRARFANYTLYAYIGFWEAGRTAFFSGLTVFAGLMVSFFLIYKFVMRAIKRDVADGLAQTNHLVNQVTQGDFNVYASIRHNQEFDHLSNGLNQMLQELRRSREEQNAQLEEMALEASHDLMTGLYNRKEIERRVDGYIKDGAEKERAIIILLDMDFFKEINDTYGHPVGDKVLIHFAEVITEIFGEKGSIGRLGGDEFVVFLPNTGMDAELKHKLNEVLEKMRERREYGGNQLRLSCSIGVSVYPLHGTTRSELYHAADIALYAAKKQGKGRFVFYDPKAKNYG